MGGWFGESGLANVGQTGAHKELPYGVAGQGRRSPHKVRHYERRVSRAGGLGVGRGLGAGRRRMAQAISAGRMPAAVA